MSKSASKKVAAPVLAATLTIPKLETRRVWAGLYGGHYDIIVFFKEKPEYDHENCYYDCLDNKSLIVGDMALGDFYHYFPGADLSAYTQSNGRPLGTEIPEVFEIDLTAIWDEYDSLASITLHNDWA